MRQMIKEMNSTHIKSFPGTHPVSLSRQHLPLLEAVYSEPSAATESSQHKHTVWQSQCLFADKLDGERFFLYLDHQSAYLIDRRLNVFISELSTSDYAGTLLDGELFSLSSAPIRTMKDGIGDKKRKREETEEASQAETVLHFVAFDILSLSGTNTTMLPFKDRMSEAKLRLSELIIPQAHMLPLTVHLQRFTPLHELPELILKKRSESQPTEDDRETIQLPIFPESAVFPTGGLILQNALSPYRVGHSESLLKWKDPKHNTIDLRLLPLDALAQSGEWLFPSL